MRKVKISILKAMDIGDSELFSSSAKTCTYTAGRAKVKICTKKMIVTDPVTAVSIKCIKVTKLGN